jgi:uncharacterized protein (TIGR03437 family)
MMATARLLLAVASLSAVPMAAQTTPQIKSIVNGAAFTAIDGYTSRFAPGLCISIFGTALSNGATQSASGTPLPTKLAGSRVLVNGIPAPLYFVSPAQINAQIQTEFAVPFSVSVQVEVEWPSGTVIGAGPSIQLNRFAPGIFTLNANGLGPGAVLRSSDYSLICPPGRSDCAYNPARVGEAVSIFASGLGPVDGPWLSGYAGASAYPTSTTPKVWIGGLPAVVLYSGTAPGFVGLYQINVLVPGGVAGDNLGLGLSMDSTSSGASNTVSMPVVAVTSCPASPVKGGPQGGKPLALAAHPRNPGVVFAGTEGNGLFRSTDFGQTWNAVATLKETYVYALAFAPSDPTVLYAATGLGVYRSRDGGSTWTDVAMKYGGPATALAVDALDPSLVYAGHQGVGFIKSVDGGDTWQVPYAESPGRPVYIRSITIQPGFSNAVYMAVDPGGVLASFDAGKTWGPPPLGLPGNVQVYSLVNQPTGTGLFAGTSSGVYLSLDSGNNWSSSSAGMSGLAVHTLSRVGGLYYAGTTQGVYWTFNTGGSWAAANGGLPLCSVRALAADAGDSHVLYAATATAGVYKSVDGGYSWAPAGKADEVHP